MSGMKRKLPQQTLPTSTEIQSAFTSLSTLISVPQINYPALTFGPLLGSGGFGTVNSGTWSSSSKIDVAIKTVNLSLEDGSTLKDFMEEVKAAWLSGKRGGEKEKEEEEEEEKGRVEEKGEEKEEEKKGSETLITSNNDSTICRTYGISFSVLHTSKPRVHLVMEKLSVTGDLHDTIQSSEYWEYKPDRIRPKTYACLDSDGDYMLYTMSRSMKISLATQIARSLRECKEGGVLHNDIKPGNILLLEKRGTTTSKKKKGKKKKIPEPERCRIKLIDFGLGGTPEDTEGYSCGTPGYRAPEVTEYGQTSYKSDIFSAGICILEIWMGRLWDDPDEDDEVKMRRFVVDCLRRLEKNDPPVATLLRRCLTKEPTLRPSAKELQKELIKIRKNS
ncbi:hypothetical protein TrLO_g4382 [Triparma laevis f. longispina]|uniref:Protein kinase domain-containing protein n=1 Tax=Triparma laevis f. longispina TaxID=1714387 RepID=A0A9W7APW9_9STRA|nr:hypothetical protein TrLO_g4382 [Triparma laevis f. longispina]